MAKAVKEASYYHEMLEYLTSTTKWPPGVVDKIDWKARASAHSKLRKANHLTILKLEFDLFATRARRNKFENNTSEMCPRCLQVPESYDHVLLCPLVLMETKAHWVDTKKAIVTRRTCLDVMKHFEEVIYQWLEFCSPVTWSGPIPSVEDRIGQTIHQAFEEQSTIGWGQAIWGRLSKLWGIANSIYCTIDTMHPCF
jgi:hypothetical protein